MLPQGCRQHPDERVINTGLPPPAPHVVLGKYLIRAGRATCGHKLRWSQISAAYSLFTHRVMESKGHNATTSCHATSPLLKGLLVWELFDLKMVCGREDGEEPREGKPGMWLEARDTRREPANTYPMLAKCQGLFKEV